VQANHIPGFEADPATTALFHPSPCLSFPAGQFGGAWYRQKMDFNQFPGAVLATTNCVIEPTSSYKENLFTVNAVGGGLGGWGDGGSYACYMLDRILGQRQGLELAVVCAVCSNPQLCFDSALTLMAEC
jgi:hypothetical protein